MRIFSGQTYNIYEYVCMNISLTLKYFMFLNETVCTYTTNPTNSQTNDNNFMMHFYETTGVKTWTVTNTLHFYNYFTKKKI